VTLLMLGVVQGYPQVENRPWLQQQQNPWLRPQPQSSSSSTTTAATPANQEPRYLACLQTCPATSEYNPICGSDNNNYYNQNKFNCAVSCGLGK
ncbi:hypothetical protein KR054_012280, partial [Drosophila jambulina]